MRIKGILKELIPHKGFGVIHSESHFGKITLFTKDVIDTLEVGDLLEFELIHDLSLKKSYARNVKLHIPEISKDNFSLHLYMPWNPGYIHDQMFQLRDCINKYGSTWIPKINSTKGKQPFNSQILDVIDEQLKAGIETCLYMTNFNCIHIWQISNICRTPVLPEQDKLTTLNAYEGKHEAEFWIQVKDVYILQADHDGKLLPILQELEKLSLCEINDLKYNPNAKITPYMSAQRYPAAVVRCDDLIFFPGVAKENIRADGKSETTREKWLNTHRKVTKEYNLMNEHMSKNIYPGTWSTFNRTSQHFLIEMEMLKIESAGYNSTQSLQFAKQKFECYASAILNELEDIVSSRIRDIVKKEGLREIDYYSNNQTMNSLPVFFGKGNDNKTTDLGFFQAILLDETWKNNLKKLITSKAIGDRASQIILEDIIRLCNNQVFVKKLRFVTKLRNWYSHDYFHLITKILQESNKQFEQDLIIKLTNILNTLSSPYSQNNLLIDIYKHKSKNMNFSLNFELEALVAELPKTIKDAA